MTADPVVIVGGGLAGAGAAWALTRRGVPVTLVEQFAADHPYGGSHGSARIVRRAYGDPLYAQLTGRAFDLWDEVQAVGGATLIRLLGGLDFGADRDVDTLAATLTSVGAGPQVLEAAAAAERWPGMRFEGRVVYHPQAGVLDAAAAVRTLLDLARAGGATVRHGTAVRALRRDGVLLADGSVLPARCVVLAAGGWAEPLLRTLTDGGDVDAGAGGVGAAVRSDAGVLPPLTVTRQSVFHFPRRDPAAPEWPSTIHDRPDAAVYHLAGGRDGGPGADRKIGVHDPGPVVAAGSPAEIDPARRRQVIDYVQHWLPGLVPEPRGETTCLYTSTPTEDFVLDRVDDLVVCSPCSGHGAKFAPLVGEWVAALVTGESAGPGTEGRPAGPGVPDRFRLSAHRAAAGRRASL